MGADKHRKEEGKRGPRRRTTIGGQFPPRLVEMLEAPAYRVLTLSAHRVLDRIEIELRHHGGTNNGKLVVTYDDFQRYGMMDRHSVGPAIREVVALGFIEITEHGRAGNAEWRTPSKYRLTYQPTDCTDPTHEWRRISTIEQALEVAKVSRMQKQKSSGGKHQVSVGEAHTNSANSPVGKTPTTVPVGKTPTTLDISGRSTAREHATATPQARPEPVAPRGKPQPSPPAICAQCGAPGDDYGPVREQEIGRDPVWLHRACHRFYVKRREAS
jgi:hypothetical protein